MAKLHSVAPVEDLIADVRQGKYFLLTLEDSLASSPAAAQLEVERSAREGWSLAEDGGITVAVSTELDDELLLEARVLDLTHEVNGLRKEQGLELTDRIRLTLPESERDLEPYAEQIKSETLALELGFDAVLSEPKLERVER